MSTLRLISVLTSSTASPFELPDGLVEKVHEVIVADGLHGPALPVTEEIAGAADLEVLGGQPEPGAQLGELLEGLEPLLGRAA